MGCVSVSSSSLRETALSVREMKRDPSGSVSFVEVFALSRVS